MAPLFRPGSCLYFTWDVESDNWQPVTAPRAEFETRTHTAPRTCFLITAPLRELVSPLPPRPADFASH